MPNWDDYRAFLAIAETGSLSAAGRKLGVSQPTLSRRLTALEEKLDASLFIRTPNGLDLTETGEQILDHVRHMADEAGAVERLATGHDRGLEGTVVISVVEAIGMVWLTRHMARFRARYPGITIEIKIDLAAADLIRREADIAVRMFRPHQANLIAKKVGSIHYGFYATEAYLEARGTPGTVEDLRGHDMVAPGAELLRYVEQQLRDQHIPLGRMVFRSNSMFALVTATRSGYGIGVHSGLAAYYPEMIRILPEITPFKSDLWLVTHTDLKRSARIRAVFDFLSELFADHRAVLRGEGPPPKID